MSETKRISARIDQGTRDTLGLYCAMNDVDISTAVRRGIQCLGLQEVKLPSRERISFEENLRLLLKNLSDRYIVALGNVYYDDNDKGMYLVSSIDDISQFIIEKEGSCVFLVYLDESKLRLSKEGVNFD